MKIALAYNEEDSGLIKNLETDLSSSNYSFVHFDFSKSKPDYLLFEALADYQWPILLFVSDKFLKSATSMTSMLQFFQQKEDQIYPVLLPENEADKTGYPEIEKVGGIIKYINYWQESYLDLRRQKKELTLADEESFNDHLKRIREISTEIGEFLRQLRSSTYCNLAEFEASDYEIFFEFIDDAPAWEQFKVTRKKVVNSEPEVAVEEKSEHTIIEEQLSSIPGISLLPQEEEEAADDIQEVEVKEEVVAEEPVQMPEPEAVVEEPEPVTENNEAPPEQQVVEEEELKISLETKIEETKQKVTQEEKDMSPKQETNITEDIQVSATDTAIEALKDNINRLSEILKEKEEAAKKAKVDRPGTGKTVFITGGTSGIGKATAEIFAKNGYSVIITGRRKERIDELTQEFAESYDTSVKGLVFDVRDKSQVESALESLGKDVKKIDILINNAGKAKGFDPIHEGSFDHWEEMIDTNIKGLLYLTRLVAPYMVNNKSGHIINIGSIAGKEAYPNGNVYCATKFAVDGLTKAMRIDLHKHNIRVSQIAPAHVEETEFALVRFDGDEDKAKIYDDFKPLNSTDIAETLYFMATRPGHVNILDVVIQGTQQPSATIIDRSGR